MPGTVPNGTLNRLYVGTSWPPAVPVGRLQQYEFGVEAETTKEEFYGDDPITTVGDAVWDGTGSGKHAYGDAGQAILKAAAKTQDLVYLAGAPNGADGDGAPGRVSRWRTTGQGPKTAAGYSFNFVQDGAIADLGGGLD